MFAENADVFLADFGLACVAGGVSFTGILDQADEQLTGAHVPIVSTMRVLVVKSSVIAAASISGATAITVAGVGYTVREVLLEDDGTFTRLLLTKS